MVIKSRAGVRVFALSRIYSTMHTIIFGYQIFYSDSYCYWYISILEFVLKFSHSFVITEPKRYARLLTKG